MTLEHMIYHAQCVERAVEKALIVVDMPFGTYQGNSRLALESAIKIMKETNGHAVKLEGGSEIVEIPLPERGSGVSAGCSDSRAVVTGFRSPSWR